MSDIMQLSVGIDEPAIEITRDFQIEGLTGSFIGYTFRPEPGVKSFDADRMYKDLKKHIGVIEVHDYTDDEDPAVVALVWDTSFDPLFMNEYEAYEAIWPYTRVINKIDIEDYVTR